MARNQRKYNTEYIIGPADITTTMNIYAEAAKEKKQGAIANWNGKNHVKNCQHISPDEFRKAVDFSLHFAYTDGSNCAMDTCETHSQREVPICRDLFFCCSIKQKQ